MTEKILKPSGRLDSATASDFEKETLAAIDAGATLLLMDFSDLQFISSMGLRVVLTAAKRMKSVGGKFGLCAMNASIGEVFRIAGFTAIVEVFPTAEVALAKLR
ncbi:MAG TPA: STAS domain-containing protein [Stellaceae bacterium]|nr:STAS domain-containing protein [Stellaceae bacterium]